MSEHIPQRRIRELDGLRGAAIVLVLLYHYGYLTPRGASASFLTGLQKSFGIGWAGVDLFFVLSGFLIGGILLDARGSESYFSTFYARRFFRIMPLYYLWIGIYFVLTLTVVRVYLAPLGTVSERWSSIPIYLFFVQNMTKNLHSNLGTAWLAHLWSLAVEEQFYLLMPLAVRFLPRRRLVPLLLAAILGAPVARIVVFKYLSKAHAIQYMLTPCRADALAMGVLLAVFWRDDRWTTWLSSRRALLTSVTLSLAAVVAYLAFYDPSPYSFVMTTWGFSAIDLFFSCLLVIALLVPEGVFGAVCRLAFLAELGRLSYCMYITHEVVNLLCHSFLRGDIPRITSWQSAGVTLLSALATYGIAKVSWAYFENPLLQRGRAYRY